jgi:hypothetical protein
MLERRSLWGRDRFPQIDGLLSSQESKGIYSLVSLQPFVVWEVRVQFSQKEIGVSVWLGLWGFQVRQPEHVAWRAKFMGTNCGSVWTKPDIKWELLEYTAYRLHADLEDLQLLVARISDPEDSGLPGLVEVCKSETPETRSSRSHYKEIPPLLVSMLCW